MQIVTTKKRTWLLLIILLLLFFLISSFVLTPEPTEYPNYGSNSPAPNGVKAFYTYLEKEKLPVERWFYSPGLLSKSAGNQVLLMVQPKGIYFSKKAEQKPYVEFMEAGNTIILFTSTPNGKFNLAFNQTDAKSSAAKFISVKTQEGNKFKAMNGASVTFQPENGDEVLLTNADGPVAFKRHYGKGQLIVCNSPGWLTNRNILKYDHIPLILSLLNEGNVKNAEAVLLDEYTHGLGKTAYSIYPQWLLILMAQGALMIIMLLWMQGKRFGPILAPREEFVRFSDERIQALAAWYMKCRLYKDSLFIQADYVKLLLQERWGIPYKAGWKDHADILERKWVTAPASEIRQFLNDLTLLLQKERISKQEYLLWSKKLEQLRKEVEQE